MTKLLFTGASGFLGNNIKPTLCKNYEVHTIGLGDEDDIRTDIAKEVPKLDEQYELVLHAAGKAHMIPSTKAEKQIFFDVNYHGTVNLCTALERNDSPKALVFISTVAVYGCESGQEISEEHSLDGNTPYAKSKIMAEQYLSEWCLKNRVTLGILRPSLLAGHNAPGNLGAMLQGIKSGAYLSIAHGKAHKSVLMANDIANILPLIVDKGGVYNVCDSHHPTLGELEELIAAQLGKRPPISIPYWTAKCMAYLGNLLGNKAPLNIAKLKKITESLTFSNEKARRELNWEPLDVLSHYKI